MLREKSAAPLITLTEAEAAWAAGLLDGDGCIRIRKQSAGLSQPAYTLVLSIGMCSFATVRRLTALLPGSRSYPDRRKSGGKPYRVVLHAFWFNRSAEVVLRRLQPYLFTKAAQVTLALEFCQLIGVKGVEGRSEKERLYGALRAAKRA